MTKEDIFDHIQFLHANTTNGFYNYISQILLYNEDFRKALDELGLTYTTLNKRIIDNIKQYQKLNNLNFSMDLKVRGTAIVLKKLKK